MMNEFEKTMEETFDIQVEESAPIQEFKQARKNTNVNDRDKDYEYVRGSLYDLIEKGQEAVNGALEIAQESGHPRAFEVAGNLIKQTTEMAE
jgi:aspartyl-tRNA synthetase